MLIIFFITLGLLAFLPGYVWFFFAHSKVLKSSYEREKINKSFNGPFAQYKEYRKFRWARGTRMIYYKLRLKEFCIIYIPTFIIIAISVPTMLLIYDTYIFK